MSRTHALSYVARSWRPFLLLAVGCTAEATPAFAGREPCPPHFEIGQTYAEIQRGACPDIDSVASFITDDSTHAAYLCRSKNVMVVGDRRNGKMDGFFLVAVQH